MVNPQLWVKKATSTQPYPMCYRFIGARKGSGHQALGLGGGDEGRPADDDHLEKEAPP